jgi:putative oxidoreductase
MARMGPYQGEATMAASSEGQIDSSRLLIPGLAGFYQAVAPYSYAMIRFIAGAILVLHGYNKLFVFGVQGVADMLTIEFVIITIWHYGNGYTFSSPHGGYEYPLVLLVLYAAIFFRGAGRCSIDRMIGKEF